MLKKIIPPSLRLRLRVLHKNLQDRSNGQYRCMIRQDAPMVNFSSQLQMSQPIRPNAYSDNKIHNLQLAIAYIKQLEIAPKAIFSFWELIPQPNQQNGFRKGRNLIGNRLAADYGGGLCQLSGILYHLALTAGLDIIERFPHSKDIYTEATRYTPLGSDAAVVYGHKDLRIRNSLDQAISFDFELHPNKIIAQLCATAPIEQFELLFTKREEEGDWMAKVQRRRGEHLQLISEDRYVRD